MSVLRLHPQSADTQTAGCRALLALLSGPNTALTARAAAVGAVAVVAGAIKSHAGAPGTQQAGCAALAALCTGPWGASATAVGCVESVCAAFLLHRASRGVQDAAVDALLALCACDSGAVRKARESMARGLVEGYAREYGASAPRHPMMHPLLPTTSESPLNINPRMKLRLTVHEHFDELRASFALQVP